MSKFYVVLLLMFLAAWRVASLSCQEGWTLYEGKCYSFSQDQKSFFDASTACEIQGGHLTEIRSSANNDFLDCLRGARDQPSTMEMIEKPETETKAAWIGLTEWGDQMTVESYYLWVPSFNTLTYTNWDSGEPSDPYYDNEDCVEMLDDGKWNDIDCFFERRYFCEKGLGPTGWTFFDGKYYILSQDEKRFIDASFECTSQGGYLAEISSSAENEFLVSLRNDRDATTWIGLTDLVSPGHYKWYPSFKSASYTNWDEGEPYNAGPVYCVEMIGNGKWNVVSCINHEKKYFCEKGKSG